MLIVDIHALLTVGLLDFLNEIVVNGVDTPDMKDILRIESAFADGVALLDRVPVLDLHAGGVGQGVGDGLPVVGHDGHIVDAAALLGVLHGDLAGNLGQLGHPLGTAGLEQLLNTGQTLRDIAAGHAAGVEGTHGQLGARWTGQR